jgi:hypothetical protein
MARSWAAGDFLDQLKAYSAGKVLIVCGSDDKGAWPPNDVIAIIMTEIRLLIRHG